MKSHLMIQVFRRRWFENRDGFARVRSYVCSSKTMKNMYYKEGYDCPVLEQETSFARENISGSLRKCASTTVAWVGKVSCLSKHFVDARAREKVCLGKAFERLWKGILLLLLDQAKSYVRASPSSMLEHHSRICSGKQFWSILTYDGLSLMLEQAKSLCSSKLQTQTRIVILLTLLEHDFSSARAPSHFPCSGILHSKAKNIDRMILLEHIFTSARAWC